MTLKQLLISISDYAIHKKLINYSCAGSSIYAINPKEINSYPILFASPTGNHSVTPDTTEYQITLYYLDRLLADSSNDIDIFSSGIEILKDLINGIKNINGIVDVSEDYNVINFTETERLNDRIAGAYTTVDITVLNASLCPE